MPLLPDIHSLVTKHDSEIDGLKNDIGEVKQEVRKGLGMVSDKVDAFAASFSAKIDALVASWSEKRETNWGTLAAWAGVLIIAGGGLFLYIDKGIEAERRINQLVSDHNREIRAILLKEVEQDIAELQAALKSQPHAHIRTPSE